MLTRAQKEEQVAELKEKFSRATCVYLADYRGVDVQSVNELRRRIRREGNGEFEYRVAKNRLLRRASEDSEVASIVDHFSGPTALALSYGDPVGLARILVDFAKSQESFELKAGVVEGARARGAPEDATTVEEAVRRGTPATQRTGGPAPAVEAVVPEEATRGR